MKRFSWKRKTRSFCFVCLISNVHEMRKEKERKKNNWVWARIRLPKSNSILYYCNCHSFTFTKSLLINVVKICSESLGSLSSVTFLRETTILMDLYHTTLIRLSLFVMTKSFMILQQKAKMFSTVGHAWYWCSEEGTLK